MSSAVAKSVELDIPSFLVDAVRSGSTSLGDNPAFPSSIGSRILVKLLASEYAKVSEAVDGMDVGRARELLSKYMTHCMRKEQSCREALEALCVKCVNDVIPIPDNTINIECKIVGKVDASSLRSMPEDVDDYTYDTIDDMNNLSDEVYKRRFLNSLVCGAAYRYGSDISSYVQDLFSIDPELSGLYSRIIALNEYLMYADDTPDASINCGGKVEVDVGGSDERVSIKAEGILFPFLLSETFKGLFELAASHGLPDDKERAMYVMKKSDFTSAEAWDTRIGAVVWDAVYGQAADIEPNFFILELSKMPVDEFNASMREMIASTRRGKEMIDDIKSDIRDGIDRDDFDQYMSANFDKYQLDDSMRPEEILTPEMCEEFERRCSLTEGVESKNMSAAKHYLYDRLGCDEKEAMRRIGDVKRRIPNSRRAKCKFLQAAVRMTLDGQLADDAKCSEFNKMLAYISSGAHVNEYDQDLNGMSADDVIGRFSGLSRGDVEKSRQEMSSVDFGGNAAKYNIVRIDDEYQAAEYAEYVSWCITQDPSMYENYTNGGENVFYFCLREGFEDEEPVRGDGCPLDSYGLSMIAVSVYPDGSANTVTCRWNHDNGGNDSIMDERQLSRVIGRNFYEVFKPLSEDEIKANRQRVLGLFADEAWDYFNYDKKTFFVKYPCDPEENDRDPNTYYVFFYPGDGMLEGKAGLFDEDGEMLTDRLYTGFVYRKADVFTVMDDTIRKEGLIRTDGKLINGVMYDRAINCFDKGYGAIYEKGKGWMAIRKDGSFILPYYVYDINITYNGKDGIIVRKDKRSSCTKFSIDGEYLGVCSAAC